MTQQPTPKPTDIPTIHVKLGFNEGLNFGCGFFVAGALFTIVGVPAVLILIAALGLSLGG